MLIEPKTLLINNCCHLIIKCTEAYLASDISKVITHIVINRQTFMRTWASLSSGHSPSCTCSSMFLRQYGIMNTEGHLNWGVRSYECSTLKAYRRGKWMSWESTGVPRTLLLTPRENTDFKPGYCRPLRPQCSPHLSSANMLRGLSDLATFYFLHVDFGSPSRP